MSNADVWNGKPTDVWDIGGCRFTVQQNAAALRVWNDYLTRERFDLAIEIGTGTGGVSFMLAQHIHDVRTYDSSGRPPTFRHSSIKYVFLDVLKYPEIVQTQFQRPVRKLLLCDGGNKPEEVRLFGSHLHSGDVLAVHDFAPDRDEFDRRKCWGWLECQQSDIKDERMSPVDGFEMTGWGVFNVE